MDAPTCRTARIGVKHVPPSVRSLREFAVHITTAADRLCAVLDVAASEGREVEMWRLFGALTMEVRSGLSFRHARIPF